MSRFSAGLGRCLVLLLSLTIPCSARAAEQGDVVSPPPPESKGLQGNEGVVVQTMCTNCNSANIDLGGLGGELLPIDVDGFPLVGGLMTIYALQVDGPLIANIAVSKGPGDYEAPPEAIGGWIHITSPPSQKRAPLTAITETGSFGWRNAHLLGSWSHKGLMLGGQYVNAQSNPVDANDDGFHETGELDRRMLRAEARYLFSNGTLITAAANDIREDGPFGHGKYFAPAPGSGDGVRYGREDAFVNADGQHLGLDAPIGENGRLTVRAMAFNRLHETFEQSVSPEQLTLDQVFTIDESHRTVDLRYGHFLVDRGLQFSAGVSWRTQEDDIIAWQQTDIQLKDVLDKWSSVGVDAGVNWQVSPRWGLRFGSRYDRFTWSDETLRTGLVERKENAVSPRARVTFKPSDAWQFALSLGKGARAPRPIYEEVCCGQRLSPTSNVQLETSRAVAFDAQWQPNATIRVGLYAHRTELDDHIVRMVATSLIGVQTYALGNFPEARYQGVTLTSRLRLMQGFNADISLTALQADSTGGPAVVYHFLPIGPSQLYRHEIPFDRVPYTARRSGTLQLGYNAPTGKWDGLVQAQYQGSMPIQHWFASFNDVSSGACSLFGPGGVDPQLCLKNGLQDTPDFWVYNARFSLRLAKWLRLNGGVDNLGDYVQSDLLDPTNDYNWGPIRGRYFYGGLTFTVD